MVTVKEGVGDKTRVGIGVEGRSGVGVSGDVSGEQAANTTMMKMTKILVGKEIMRAILIGDGLSSPFRRGARI